MSIAIRKDWGNLYIYKKIENLETFYNIREIIYKKRKN